MANRALIEKRPMLLASLLAATAFCALRLTAIPEIWLIALPGLATGFLALYAWFQKAGRDGGYLVAMMAVAAVRDVMFQVDLAVSALIFFVYHMLAMSLYLRHPREHTRQPKKRRPWRCCCLRLCSHGCFRPIEPSHRHWDSTAWRLEEWLRARG